jgi:nucleoside-diphosphate-sugar epimerase
VRVFVAGATGVIGRPLCAQLVAAGHEVTALTRSAANAERLQGAGVTPVVADVFDAAAVTKAMTGARPAAVIHQLTAIPARMPPRQAPKLLEPTNRLRTEGTAILLAAARTAGVKRFVAQSISFVVSPDGPSPASEEPVWSSPPRAARKVFESVAELETMVTTATDLVGVALRFGSLHGPKTIFDPVDGDLIQGVRRRMVPIIGHGDGVFGFCHVDDAARATVCALDRGAGIYNIVDDEPARCGDWLPHLANVLGARPPRRIPRWLATLGAGSYAVYLMARQRAISNAKARAELGFVPAMPWRDTLGRV